jgi:hypothetical protein
MMTYDDVSFGEKNEGMCGMWEEPGNLGRLSSSYNGKR